MKQLFKDITAELDTIAELRWVDEDKGQMNYEQPTVAFPCALVNIGVPRSKGLTKTIRECTASITIKLCVKFSGNTSTVTPQAARDISLEYYDLIDTVDAKMEGFFSDNFNALRLVNISQTPRQGDIKIINLTYATDFHWKR